MKFVLKESAPREYNTLLPVYFLTTESREEHKIIYGTRGPSSYFFRKKTTLTYDQWFQRQISHDNRPNLVPLHYWFSVSSVNISKNYWDNFFFIYPYSILAVYFHITELQRDKLTKIQREQPGKQNVYWTTTPPDIHSAIKLNADSFVNDQPYSGLKFNTEGARIGHILNSGRLDNIFTNIIPIHVTFYTDALDHQEILPFLIFDILHKHFILHRSFIASPSVDSFADSRTPTSFEFTKNGQVIPHFK